MERIITERLILGELSEQDATDVFKWLGDDRVSKYMVYDTYESVEQVKEWILSVNTLVDEYTFGIATKNDGNLIGSISLKKSGRHEDYTFGYNLAYEYWNNGYATEAVKAIIRFALGLGARKFIVDIAEKNIASRRVLEKCGLHFDRYDTLVKLSGKPIGKSMVYEGEFAL